MYFSFITELEGKSGLPLGRAADGQHNCAFRIYTTSPVDTLLGALLSPRAVKRRPQGYYPSADGEQEEKADDGARTRDHEVKSLALYRLSYIGEVVRLEGRTRKARSPLTGRLDFM